MKYFEEHPEMMKKVYFAQAGVTLENYPFEADEEWKAHERNVELPADGDQEVLMQKVKAKWYDQNIALHEMPDFGGPEGAGDPDDLEGNQDAMKVFDQGLKLMWKLGVMEAEEVCREVVRALCDAKSEFNMASTAKLTKEQFKKRAQGIHHIGEKYKAVAARLKNDKKKGFTVQDFLDENNKKTQDRPNGPEDEEGNDNNSSPTPGSSEPEAPAANVAEPHNATEDID